MADTTEYTALRDKVVAWSNRDREVFGLRSDDPMDNMDQTTDPDVLDDFLKYAADKAYRVLRVPALEKTHVYTITANDNTMIDNNCLPIPSDLTEFISISKSQGVGVATGCPLVYNQKQDYRTFRDSFAVRTKELYWARFGGNILLSPFPGVNAPDDNGNADVFELYYYGRPAGGLNGVYPANTFVTIGYNDDGTAIEQDLSGSTIFNWMRDENERVLLFGALAEAFSYLGEEDMMQKYMAMFNQEIGELNSEDNQRQGSGGNVQTQYTSYLL